MNDLVKTLKDQVPGAIIEPFATDTSPDKLRKAFADIKAHQSFKDLKLRLAIFSIKNSAKKPFMQETFEDFMEPLESYVGGAMVFAQESLKRMFEDHGEKTLAEGAEKKGTIIFTGTLGALRANAEFASYGASRASVRQLAQALAKEMSSKGVSTVDRMSFGMIIVVELTMMSGPYRACHRQWTDHRRGQRRHQKRQAYCSGSRWQDLLVAASAGSNLVDGMHFSLQSSLLIFAVHALTRPVRLQHELDLRPAQEKF